MQVNKALHTCTSWYAYAAMLEEGEGDGHGGRGGGGLRVSIWDREGPQWAKRHFKDYEVGAIVLYQRGAGCRSTIFVLSS